MPTTSPTTDNGRLIASMYEAFGRGDVPYVVERIADPVEWIETDADIPTRGTYRTPQDVVQHVFAAIGEHFESFELRPELWIEHGDDVVVTGRVAAVTRTGSKLDSPFAHVFTVRAGKVVRNDNHHDTALWSAALSG